MDKKSFKVVAFDVDGTLVSQNSSWITCHNHFQTKDLAGKNLECYKTGDIDYETFMRWDIGLWPKPLHVDQLKPVLYTYTLVPKAKIVINELKKRYEVVLVSAGIDILVEDVARTLGIKYFIANGIEINNKGFVTGNGIFSIDLLRKDIAMTELLSQLDFSNEECVAIGDSIYDMSFLKSAGLGIAIGINSPLKEIADHCVDNLEDITDLI